jgi:hypothetical protein
MRRLALALLVLIAFAPACRIHKKDRAQSTAQPVADDGELLSVVNVADPRAALQLTRGFHGLEQNAWRWTMKDFTVTLRPPRNAATNGASLQLKFTIPPVVFNRVGDMGVDARINGADLGAQTYSQSGDATYTREVPAAALAGDAVAVDFHVDKGLPPGADTRELAVIVTTVGLLPK